jgi:cytochrome c-type biogenesis protein CcmH/NrfG
LKPDEPTNKLALAAADLNYALQFGQPDSYGQQFEEARSLLTELTKIWPDNGDVYFMLGRTLRVMRRYTEAIPILKRAHELMPQHADAVVELARCYSFSNDRATARSVLESALKSGVESGNLYGLYAQLIQQSGEPNSEAKSVDAYEKAVKLAPHDTTYLERLGSAYLRINRVEDARKLFEKMALDDPNRSYPFQQLAVIYARMGQRERAAAAATMATRMVANENQLRQIQLLSSQHPENVNLYLALADRYMQLQALGPAQDAYTQALKVDPKNSRAKAGLAKLESFKNAKTGTAHTDSGMAGTKSPQ